MTASGFDVQLIECCGPIHLADVAALRQRGFHLPHQCTVWPLHDSQHDWLWCRVVDASGHLITAFSIEMSNSRGLPGTRIGRIERLGRALHFGAMPVLDRVLVRVAQAIPRLQRLDVQVFDEDPERRRQYGERVLAAGGTTPSESRGYTRTVRLNLLGSEEALLASLRHGTRRKIRACFSTPLARTSPVTDPRYLRRLKTIHGESFHRTGSVAPRIEFADVLRDATSGGDSALIGVFAVSRPMPEDLIAFGWGRLHGDHVAYEAGGSENSDEVRCLSPGYAVLWDLGRWARTHAATWLDLGGITAPDEPDSHPLHGISSFKRRISRDELEVASEYRLEPNSMIGRLARAARTLQARIVRTP